MARTVFASDGSAEMKAMVSSSSRYSSTYPASAAFNGTVNNVSADRWVSGSGVCSNTTYLCTDTWYQWDFGVSKTMSGIRIAVPAYYGQNGQFPSNLTIVVSDTGAFAGEEVTIGTIDVARPGGAGADATYNGQWSDWVDFPGNAVGQYIRFQINAVTLGSGTNSWIAVGEFELMEGGLTPGSATIRALLEMLYDIQADTVRMSNDMPYAVLFSRLAYMNQLYGIKLGTLLTMYYGDALCDPQRAAVCHRSKVFPGRAGGAGLY